ncbi:hypothetical protein H2199_003756 [Coniosporium tulheliwenetii]|uniref:Uncharacterized protein n=1 Tax=Coniosporium tulheliwenetii TaxID=3383036 RepID=A0ACC2Z891_9PEZI|nr:hypothetical protein H2199_003756 [Cladosporium sp. JES 115]
MVYNVTAEETQPVVASHFNGTTEEIYARYCVSELCKGWPIYRDASEWQNYRSIFTKEGACVWTTWSGGVPIDEFIKVSKEGREKGDFIMHRECGTLVDLDLAQSRAVGKMKATITQRFTLDGCEVDVECDARFIFFCMREDDEWKARFKKVFCEKSKVIPVDGKNAPSFPQDVLAKYPEGYKYLAVAQHMAGHPILNDLPTLNNKGVYQMYEAMGAWLRGEEIDLFWEKSYEYAKQKYLAIEIRGIYGERTWAT